MPHALDKCLCHLKSVHFKTTVKVVLKAESFLLPWCIICSKVQLPPIPPLYIPEPNLDLVICTRAVALSLLMGSETQRQQREHWHLSLSISASEKGTEGGAKLHFVWLWTRKASSGGGLHMGPHSKWLAIVGTQQGEGARILCERPGKKKICAALCKIITQSR